MPGLLPENRLLKGLMAVALVVAALHPLFYFNTFSGDAEIHLVYARNFLDGFPLQFNPGQPSSGQTSMGFMFAAVVPATKLFGEAGAPLVMKLIGLFSLYIIAFQTWRLGRRLGLAGSWPALASAATLLLPGSIYNGMLGSENAFFGALILTWTVLAIDGGWVSSAAPPTFRRDCLLALFMGLMFWIRPEAIPFGAVAWLARIAALTTVRKKFDRSVIGRAAFFAAIAGFFVIAYVLLFRHWTGILPFGAGYARLLESIDVDSVWILGLAINTKVVTRLAAYFSIVLPALYAVVVAVRDSRPGRWPLIFCGVEFFGQMGSYIFNLVTALHFARYTIYVWPFGILAAAFGCSELLRGGRRGWLVVGGAVFSFLAVGAYETLIRSAFPHDSLVAAMEMPLQRPYASERFLTQLGNPSMRPVVIAAQEVQARDVLDNRFVIRSLDGILDVVFLKYLCHGYNDHDGYFIDQKVDFLSAPFSNYNHDPARWSLARLEKLPPGASIDRPGIRYTRIDRDNVRVTRLVAHASDRKIQPCTLGPRSPYY